MTEKKKLSDILTDTRQRDKLVSRWEQTAAADELAPLPPGEYLLRVVSGELHTSRSNSTLGFKLTLEVAEGDLEGKRCWHDVWLSDAALPLAKRDLGKLGIVQLEQLDRPLPPGILIRGKVTLRRDDNGNEFNRLARFEAAGVEPPDTFEPAEVTEDAAAFDPAELEATAEEVAQKPPMQEQIGAKRHAANGAGALSPSRSGPYGGDRL